MENNTYKEIFAEHQIKKTRQRELILDILMQSKTPLSAKEIFIKLVKEEDNMSLSTIYRILDTFMAKGLVSKSTVASSNKAVYEIKGRKHKHHLVCVSCGKIILLNNCPLAKYEKFLEEDTGFDITSHSLEFFGICPECRKKMETEF